MSEIVTLFNQAEVTHSQNWMFFIVVVFGIIGYCFTEKYNQIETFGIVILAIGMIAFSIYNGNAMVRDISIYNHLLKILNSESKPGAFKKAVKIFEEKCLLRILFFHILVSLLAILVIIRKYIHGVIKNLRDKAKD